MTIRFDASSLPPDALLFAALAGIALVCVLALLLPGGRRRVTLYPFRRRGGFQPELVASRPYDGAGDAASQLRHVMAADFHKKKIMNKAEYKVFQIVEAEVRARRDGHRVLSQTSLGEIIGSDDRKAFLSINSKRADILIIDPYGDPIAAIEYQGMGHYQGTAAARDAIKREALRKAGVAFIEISHTDTPADIAASVSRVFSRLPSAQPGRASLPA